MSSPNNSKSRKKDDKVSMQHIQHFHRTLQKHLSNLQSQSNNNESLNEAYNYIEKRLTTDIRTYLLKFEPELQQYQAFTDIFIKCAEIIKELIVKCPRAYYKHLLPCFNALLGFEAKKGFECNIFIQQKYQNIDKQSIKFEFVERRITQPTPYQTRTYNKRNKTPQNPFDNTSHCQLSVINLFYKNITYFTSQIKGKSSYSRFGVFDLQKVLQILYNAAKKAKRDTILKYYAPLQQYISCWVHNLDNTSFELCDNSKVFNDLFNMLNDIFALFRQHFKSHIRGDQELIDLKLLFASKLLKCKITRRVQALSLIKIILEKARSDDNKYNKSNESNAWSTKSRHGHKYPNNNPTNNNPGYILRERCSAFILKEGILHLLMSPEYVHEQILDRLQPMIDVLCETNKMCIDTIQILWNASADKRAIESAMFYRLYLSLSKQLPPTLCLEFYDLIHIRLNELELVRQIEESHLQFVAQFSSNLIDKSKHPSQYYKSFKGLNFLKNFAIDFERNKTEKLYLRKYAFKQIGMILQKQSMRVNMESFLSETLTNMSELIEHSLAFDEQQTFLCVGGPHTVDGLPPLDLTYCIDGMDGLLKTKHVGRTNCDLYRVMNNRLDLMVKEVEYWYWYCSPVGFDDKKQWITRRKHDFKIRFDFLTCITKNTTCVIDEHHVKMLSAIPSLDKKFYKTPANPEFNRRLTKLHNDAVKTWLNTCVKLNQDALHSILNQTAIQTIFVQMFSVNMDENGFKSWLTYFHESNDYLYNPQKQEYNIGDSHKPPIGLEHMWRVIRGSSNTRVTIKMMDELIKLQHKVGPMSSTDMLHVPNSEGINRLFDTCNKQFKEYTLKIRTPKNIAVEDARNELNAIRHTLLLRRIIEYSIGKQYPSKASNSNIRYQILYRKKVDKNMRPRIYYQLDIDYKQNDLMIQVRNKIADKILKHEPQRALQLYRKWGDCFIMIEEQSLPYLRCYDLIRKKDKRKIELEYSIIDDTTASYRSGFAKSLVGRYALQYDRFVNLQRLLLSTFTTTSLSAYYALRYLPMNRTFLNELITHTDKYFSPRKPILNVYNMDMLRYYADMKCITTQEKAQKKSIIKKIYSKDVFTVLFEIFIASTNKGSIRELSGILRLFWILQFNRLCYLFHDLHVDEDIFHNNKDCTSFRVMRGFRDRSDEIMITVMDGLRILLESHIPSQQIPLYDITLSTNISNTISRTIVKCFAIAVNIIKNKQQYLDAKHDEMNDNALEETFLKGLRTINDLQKVIFSGKTYIKMAIFQGIRQFMQHDNNNIYIESLLSILIDIIPSHVTDETVHPAKFFELLTELISCDTDKCQRFIHPILRYVFDRLSVIVLKQKSSILSLLKTASTLYSVADPKYDIDVESHIELLLDKCLFGLSYLCPSGTIQREEAFKLLYTMIDRYRKTQLFLSTLCDHLNIVNVIDDNDQDNDYNDIEERQHFVGLINLSATCYFNSILQQLFMIPSFTNEILSIDTSSQKGGDHLMLHELQRVLLTLRESHKKQMNPRKLLNTVKQPDGERMEYNIQHDCSEALRTLFSQLEDEFKYLNISTNALDHHFGIQIRYVSTCCNGHISIRDEGSRTLTLTAKGVPNLLNALDKLTEAEILEADNAYACDKCDAKVRAQRKITIHNLPKQLIINLKRFDFDLEMNTRLKVNTRLEFEPVLNLEKYLYSTYMNEENKDIHIYDLVGIIIHQGKADRGHYYSYIKDRCSAKDEWYQFDDQKVSKKDFNSIQKEAFGGAASIKINDNDNDRNNPWNKQKMSKPKQESVEILSEKNAYVLFYQQRTIKKEKQAKQALSENLNEELKRITNKNKKIFRQQTLYDTAFVHFMKQMYSNIYINDMNKKTLIRFVFNVVPIQIRDKNEIKWWWNTFRQAVDKYSLEDMRQMIGSRILPKYLINIFGKYRNYDNRQCAVQFFKYLIKTIDRLQQEQQPQKDVLDTLLTALIEVINIWDPTVLTGSNMEEIIQLIHCIDEISNRKRYLSAHWEPLMKALKQLTEKDFNYIPGIRRELQFDLPSSMSNLNVKAVCKLMWHVINADTQHTNTNLIKLNDPNFLRVLISWDYSPEQVNIVRTIVETEEKKQADTRNLDTFNTIIRLIHFRMRELDYYEVFGALKILNGLFKNGQDPLIGEKLETQCLVDHLQQIISNFSYWKLTEVSILVLSQINLLARAWIKDNCFSQLQQIEAWCQKNQRFKNKNKNRNRNQRSNQYQSFIKLYRWYPPFGDRNKEAKKRDWVNRMNKKIDLPKMPNTNKTMPLWPTAFNKIKNC